MAKGRQQLAPLQPYHAAAPMELVYMDYLTIEHGRTGKDVNILIITDHYSRFAQAVQTTKQTSHTTAKAAYNHFFSKYGFPENARSHKSRAAVDYTLINVEPHGPT